MAAAAALANASLASAGLREIVGLKPPVTGAAGVEVDGLIWNGLAFGVSSAVGTDGLN